MARNALLEMLFLFLIMFGGSDASFGWKLRKLVDAGPKVKKTANGTQVKFYPFFSVLRFLVLDFFFLIFFGKIDGG